MNYVVVLCTLLHGGNGAFIEEHLKTESLSCNGHEFIKPSSFINFSSDSKVVCINQTVLCP